MAESTPVGGTQPDRPKRRPVGAASPTSRRRVEAALRQAKALTLRENGASFEKIAEALGYNDRSAAHKAVMAGLTACRAEPAQHVRKLECRRLDRLYQTYYQLAIAGDARAAELCLKIMERRSKYEGLDEPVKVRHGNDPESPLAAVWTDEERKERIRFLESWLLNPQEN